MRERGPFSLTKFYKAIATACRAAGIPTFSPGHFRHLCATWVHEAGASPEAASAFLGHKSIQTVKRLYATLATVPKVPTLA